MQHKKPSPTEPRDVRRRARAIYEAIQGKLESDLKGQVVAIEAESGEYFVGQTVLEVTQKARAKHPHKIFHFFRIGFPTVYVWR